MRKYGEVDGYENEKWSPDFPDRQLEKGAKETQMGKASAKKVDDKKGCSVDGCEETHLAKGLCKTHYWKEQTQKRREKRQQERIKEEQAGSGVGHGGGQQGSANQVLAVPNTEPEEVGAGKSAAQAPRRSLGAAAKKKVDNSIAEVTVRFYSEDKQLLEELREAAKYNRRAVSAEVLFRLDRSFECWPSELLVAEPAQ